jgi:hypothetical protein
MLKRPKNEYKLILLLIAITQAILLTPANALQNDNDSNLLWVRSDGSDSCSGQNNLSQLESATDCSWATLSKAANTLTSSYRQRDLY